jgi:choline dehydrogenase-like flavoprotein
MLRTIRAEFVIVGSGPGGATVADELAARGKDVCILEKGNLQSRSRLHRNRGRFSSAGPAIIRKALGIRPASRNIPVRTWIGVGGTSMVASANAVRGWEKELLEHGIDIAEELTELEKTIPVTPMPDRLIGKGARMLLKAADSLGIRMESIPKMIDTQRCDSCGNCNSGCPKDAKWTAEWFLRRAQDNGAVLMPDMTATGIIVSNGRAAGIRARGPGGEEVMVEAGKIILAAGAMATPVILQNAGLSSAGRNLFCHPFHVVHGPVPGQNIGKEPRAVFCDQFLEKDGFLLANDTFAGNLGIMVKTRDEADGRVFPSGAVHKRFTPALLEKSRVSVKIAREILGEAGVSKRKTEVRFHAALHPGGTAAIGHVVDARMETEIRNCFVADASLLPSPTGVPPLLTIMALAKHVAKNWH